MSSTGEGKVRIRVPCLSVRQPLGEFFIASIPCRDLVEITYFDVRRVLYDERDVERYLGIQRPLSRARVGEIGEYVNTIDACFPTAIILAVPTQCVEFDDDGRTMVLSNVPEADDESDLVMYRHIARVLDGQHRLAGLEAFSGEDFDINVSIFVGADISDQANIFSTVNLAQTKVNKSLAYDLFDLAKARSPQKLCHNIVVALDRDPDSPFYKKIKRLGTATPGRTHETLTQATVIQGLLGFITQNPMADRDTYLRGRRPQKIPANELDRTPWQHLFVDEKDFEIARIVWNYFNAVADRWPLAWENKVPGSVLPRTIGYQALTRLLKDLYIRFFEIGTVPAEPEFADLLGRASIEDEHLTSENYAYGSSGSARLFRDLCDQIL